jgi:hypothetical protein
MIIQTDDLNREQRNMAELIANLEYKELPYDLTDKVMQDINPVAGSWWRHAISWLLTPRTIRISPLVPVSALASVIFLFIFLAGGLPIKLYTDFTTDTRYEQIDQTMTSTSPEQQIINVVFTVHVNDAREVALIGSFNNWQGHKHKLTPSDEAGKWTISVPLEQGTHEYAFVVDGVRIIPDPVSLIYKDDGFGNLNSVILVEDYEQT